MSHESRVQRQQVWARPPSFPRLLLEAATFGAVAGSVVGSTTLVFQGDVSGVVLGAGLGLIYGVAFGVVGWLVAWVLVQFGMAHRKGLALGLGVTITAVSFPAVNLALGGSLEWFFVLIPTLAAPIVAFLRGKAYDSAQ